MGVRRNRLPRAAHVANTTLRPVDLVAALWAPSSLESVERRIAKTLGVDEVVLFASGRGALRAAFIALSPASRVIVQAFTCVAVANAAVAAGFNPEFVDPDARGLFPAGSLDLTDDDIVVVQDTFGLPARLPGAGRIVRDAAHRLDLVVEPGPAIAVSSLEQSKWVSAGRGGLAVVRDGGVAEQLRRIRDEAGGGVTSYRGWLFTLALTFASRAAYRGRRSARARMRMVRRLDPERFDGQAEDELAGAGIPAELAGRPDRITAALIERQVRRLRSVAEHRAGIVQIYDRACALEQQPLPLVRYPLVVADPDALERQLLEAGWDIRGRWFDAPLHPKRANAAAFGLDESATPQAAKLARTVVNLPTHLLVGSEDAERLVHAALALGARPLSVVGTAKELHA